MAFFFFFFDDFWNFDGEHADERGLLLSALLRRRELRGDLIFNG